VLDDPFALMMTLFILWAWGKALDPGGPKTRIDGNGRLRSWVTRHRNVPRWQAVLVSIVAVGAIVIVWLT
jgi:hypothetical protein